MNTAAELLVVSFLQLVKPPSEEAAQEIAGGLQAHLDPDGSWPPAIGLNLGTFLDLGIK